MQDNGSVLHCASQTTCRDGSAAKTYTEAATYETQSWLLQAEHWEFSQDLTAYDYLRVLQAIVGLKELKEQKAKDMGRNSASLDHYGSLRTRISTGKHDGITQIFFGDLRTTVSDWHHSTSLLYQVPWLSLCSIPR